MRNHYKKYAFGIGLIGTLLTVAILGALMYASILFLPQPASTDGETHTIFDSVNDAEDISNLIEAGQRNIQKQMQ